LFAHAAYRKGPICGICDVTVSRQFPGVHGIEYPHQVNPEAPDEVKAMDNLIRDCQRSRNPREHFTDDEAAMVHNVWKRDQDAQRAAEQQIGKRRIEREKAVVREEEQQAEKDHKDAQTTARRKLRDLNPVWARYKKDMGVT
jgi:hypothetical protein